MRWNLTAKFLVEGVEKANASLSSIAASAKTVDTAVKAVAGAFGSLYVASKALSFVRDSVNEWRQWDQAVRQLEAGLKSTGGAVGLTGKQLGDLAQGLENVTNFSDDTIASAEGILLTFTKITGTVFPQAIELSADLAQRLGGDLNGAAMLVGKALNDPVLGVTALSRAGVQFTAVQKEQIKALVESGHLLEAQKMILSELTTEVGGSARAAQDGFTKWEHAVGNLKQALGEGLAPALGRVAQLAAETSGDSGLESYFRNLGSAIGGATEKLAEWLVKWNQVQRAELEKQRQSGGGIFGMLGLSTTAAEDAAAEDAIRRSAEHYAPEIAKRQKETADAAARAAQEADRKAKADAAGARSLEDQKKAAERIAEATRVATEEWESARAAIKLIHDGMDPKRAEAMVEAAKALGTKNLLSPLVKQMADLRMATDDAREALEAYKRAAPGQLELIKTGPVMKADTADLSGINLLAAAEEQTKKDFNAYAEAFDEGMRRLADAWRQYSITAKGDLDFAKGQIEELVKLEQLSAEEGANAINAISQQFWGEQLGLWENALGFMGQYFGGFFKQLQQLAQGVQGARQFGQQVQGIAGSMTSNASLAAAAGGVATVVGIFAVVYDFVDKMIKKQRSVRYGSSTEYNLVDNRVGITELTGYAHDINRAIADVIRSFEDSLGIDVQTLEKIGIRVRNDGKYVAAYLGDMFLGHFQDVNAAIQAALAAALSDPSTVIAGLSDLMREGLSIRHFQSLDEAQQFLAQLKEIEDMAKPEGVAQMEAWAHHIEQLFQTLMSLPPTPATLEGIGNLLGGLTGGLMDLYNQLTGHTRSIDEEKKARAAAYNAQRAIVLAQLQLMKLELEARIAEYNVRRYLLTGGGGGGGQPGGGDGVGGPRNNAKGGYMPGQNAPTTAQNPTGDPGLQALLDARAAIIGAVTGLPGELKPGDVHLGGGRHGGGATAKDAEQFYREQQYALAQAQRGATEQRVNDIRREYDEQIKAAGKHHDLRRKLEAQEEEAIRQALEQARKDVEDSLAEFTGKSGFDQERERAKALQDQYADLFAAGALSAAEYAAALQTITQAEQQHLDTLGAQETASLFQQVAQLMEQAGGDMATSAAHAQLLHDFNVANFQLQLAAAQAKAVELEAEGYLVGDAAARVHAALDGLGAIDPETLFRPVQDAGETITRSMASGADSAAKIAHELSDALRKLKDFTDSLLLDQNLTVLSPQQQEAEARRQLAAAEAAARTGDPKAISDLAEVERKALEVFRRNEASGQVYQDLFAYILQLNATLQRIPHYADGGVTSRTQLALLHANEAVIPLRGGGVPIANDNGKAARAAMVENIRQRSAETAALYKELVGLRSEVASLRREQRPKPRELKRGTA